MLDRQRIVTTGITTAAVATVALVLWLKPWATESIVRLQPEPVAAEKGHPVDIVFAIDTTGSMGGLLDGAKRTVWSIANQVRQIDPNANLRVGLVAYRDLGDDYVTKDFALTDDLDAMYSELTSFQPAGGGDVPEDVDAALNDAVHKMKWRTGAKKMIFLVGDAPPATRGEVPGFEVTAQAAAKMQIKINAIRCGQDSDTARTWERIAMLGHGEFSTIQQDGGVQQIATPYDDKLAELSARIDSTAVISGDDATRGAYKRNMEATMAAPAPAKADRARYYTAKGAGPRASADIVDKVAAGSASGAEIEALAPADLPEEMRAMGKTELKQELAKRADARKAAQKELSKLARERDEYLKKQASDGEGGFDAKVNAAIDEQLKR